MLFWLNSHSFIILIYLECQESWSCRLVWWGVVLPRRLVWRGVVLQNGAKVMWLYIADSLHVLLRGNSMCNNPPPPCSSSSSYDVHLGDSMTGSTTIPPTISSLQVLVGSKGDSMYTSPQFSTSHVVMGDSMCDCLFGDTHMVGHSCAVSSPPPLLPPGSLLVSSDLLKVQ